MVEVIITAGVVTVGMGFWFFFWGSVGRSIYLEYKDRRK